VGEGEAQEPNDAGGRGSGLSDQQVAMARFHLLLRALELPPELLPAILDWLDADGDPRYPSGAEDEFYSLREPPYRAANRRFEEVSELRLVRGVTEEIYERLRPFVTVLDNPTPINVNTAAPEVLMSLAPGIDRSSAELLVRSRAAQSFVDLETLLAHPLLVGRPIVATGLSTDSNWFELRTRIDGEGLPHHRVSLMYRAGPDRIVTLRRRHVYPDG
jgi:general secretion pathway protein K